MRYLILLYSAADAGPSPETEEFAAEMNKWFAVTDEMGQAGVLLGGEALQPVETATTVRVRDEKVLTTDGPFAETKEVLGGFYLIDVPDLDAAREWAAKMPSALYGSSEIRPIMEIER